MNRIYLIGYRGTGKTTVGPLVASALAWHFVDADVFLEAKAGKTIREIFAEGGEGRFRDLEAENLRELSSLENHVIATGGGIVLRESNCEILKRTGFVVWLTATPQTLWERISQDHTTAERRPNLSTGGIEEIETLLRVRTPLYEEVADLRISSAGESPEAIASAIVAEYRDSLARK